MNNKFKYRAIIFILLYTHLVVGQSKKHKLDEKDYDKWYVLEDENIAPNGKWVTFLLKYNDSQDTLVVKNTRNDKSLYYPKARSGKFSPNGKWFTFYQNLNELILLNLEKIKTKKFTSIKSHQMDDTSTILAMLNTDSQLTIINLKTKENNIIENVKEYAFSVNGQLTVITESTVILIEPNFIKKVETIASNKEGYKNIVWNHNKGFCFLENVEAVKNTNPNHRINYYDLSKKQLATLNPDNFDGLDGKSIIKPFGQKALVIDQSEDKIFFYINNKKIPLTESKVIEVWESDSPLEYPSQQTKGSFENANKVAVWWPTQNELKIIGSNEKPNTIICPDSNFVLSFNPLDYEPQYELLGSVDIYLTDLKSSKTSLLLKNQSRKVQTMGASAKGNYLHYYRDKNWWTYNFKTGTHINITESLPFSIENFKQDEAGPKYSFGCAGWSSDEKHIFLYDEFDIWMISPDGTKKERITNGREENKQFRIEDELYVNKSYRGAIEFLTYTFDTGEAIIITAIDKKKNSGYYIWNNRDKLKTVYFNNSKSNRIKSAVKSEELMWIEQTATKPPSILIKKNNQTSPKSVFQTNKHYSKYESSKAELINYTNIKGDTLQGVLYYPAGYKKEKKYPMIVYIYEKLSQRLHLYENPTLYKPDGFSIANYINDDYFVLYPDITYEVGNPGISATDCVVSAVNEVIKSDKIDKGKIGLIGHSFGGYEVSFIITQADIFRTAVAGAACTDLINLYLKMNWEWNRTQAWRFESQQMRMGSTPFNNYEGYKNNSPIANAGNINTPLLSWSGKEDYNVDWNQSIYLHMALRRLKKKNKLLLFPDEGHNILKKESQVLLSKEIKNWFDSYLKEY